MLVSLDFLSLQEELRMMYINNIYIRVLLEVYLCDMMPARLSKEVRNEFYRYKEMDLRESH